MGKQLSLQCPLVGCDDPEVLLGPCTSMLHKLADPFLINFVPAFSLDKVGGGILHSHRPGVLIV